MGASLRGLQVMPAIIYLLIAAFGVAPRLSKRMQTGDSTLLAPVIYQELDRLASNLTTLVANRYSFCIRDVEKDKKRMFDFSPDLDFLTKCIQDTEGDLLLRLCTMAEIKFYFKNYIANIGKGNSYSKPNKNCNSSSWVSGCEPGWASALSLPSNNTEPTNPRYSTQIPSRTKNSRPCCNGFFCPRGLTCMIPCPLGAYCTKAALNIRTGLCEPYHYQLPTGKTNHTCGGADLWADVGSTRAIFCSAGSYCPTTVERKACSSGHYCRLGSTSETRCFELTPCNANSTNQNIQTYGVMLIAVVMTLLLIIYNCSDQVMLIRERRRAQSRERAAKSVRESTQARERWRLAKEAAKRQAINLQKQLSSKFSSRSQSKRHSEELKVLAHSGVFISDDFSLYPVPPTAKAGVSRESSGTSTPMQITSVEDLHDPEKSPGLAFSIDNGRFKDAKSNSVQTRSQVLKYAYGQIEKEKAMEKTHLTLTDAISKVGSHGSQTRPKIEVTFQDLSLTLKGNGKSILRNVTGKLRPGHIAAVMGPSGAGKTIFLNALAGKATGCIVTGSVLINGISVSMHSYKKIIGFVAQDDIIHGSLTVEENLWFSAKCRLPVSMPKYEKVLVVERVIESLGLQSIRDSLVGTVEKRGISGGQRKRVNVGIEMVMEPSLLILDEPTSGLDSSSSVLLLKALRREASAGVNICMVLHQPSYGLFKMFDDLTLLAKGGWIVYHGPVDEVEDYFSSLGFTVPERVNPADYFMDVLEGIRKPERNPNFDCTVLPITWMRCNGYEIPTDLRQKFEASTSKEASESRQDGPGMVKKTNSFGKEFWEESRCKIELRWDDVRHSFLTADNLSHRQTPGFVKQFRFYLERVAKQRFRESWIQAQDYLILVLAGACLGILAKVNDESFSPVAYTYTIIAMSLLCMISALRTFSLDRLQYWRESASGMSRVGCFLAKDCVDHFNTAIKPLVYLSMFYFFNNPRSSFEANYVVTVVLVYCVVGIAYIFAITFEPGPAQLWSVFLPILFTLVATQRKTSGFWRHLIDLSYSRWALEAYVITNAERYSGVWLISRCASLQTQGYNLNDWMLCIAILIGIGVLARLVAFLCLLVCYRDRQK